MTLLWVAVVVLSQVGHSRDSVPEKPKDLGATPLHVVPYLALGVGSALDMGHYPPRLIPPLEVVGNMIPCGGILLGPAWCRGRCSPRQCGPPIYTFGHQFV